MLVQRTRRHGRRAASSHAHLASRGLVKGLDQAHGRRLPRPTRANQRHKRPGGDVKHQVSQRWLRAAWIPKPHMLERHSQGAMLTERGQRLFRLEIQQRAPTKARRLYRAVRLVQQRKYIRSRHLRLRKVRRKSQELARRLGRKQQRWQYGEKRHLRKPVISHILRAPPVGKTVNKVRNTQRHGQACIPHDDMPHTLAVRLFQTVRKQLDHVALATQRCHRTHARCCFNDHRRGPRIGCFMPLLKVRNDLEAKVSRHDQNRHHGQNHDGNPPRHNVR